MVYKSVHFKQSLLLSKEKNKNVQLSLKRKLLIVTLLFVCNVPESLHVFLLSLLPQWIKHFESTSLLSQAEVHFGYSSLCVPLRTEEL